MRKIKVTYEGQPCRNCGHPVFKKIPKRTIKQNQPYYFKWYLQCPNPKCKSMFMVEEAKVECDSMTTKYLQMFGPLLPKPPPPPAAADDKAPWLD